MTTKRTIDWNTVELVGDLEPFVETSDHVQHPLHTVRSVPGRVDRVYPDRRGRSVLKKILSGASMKARGNGARMTHAQICKRLSPGLDVLIYGIGLLAASMASDPTRRVTLAAYVIGEAAERIVSRDPRETPISRWAV